MKVFNKEIEDCCLCPYLGNYSLDEEPYCRFNKKDITDINVIPEHCEFNKPITKEVIEGFGFKQYNKPHTYHFWMFPTLINPQFKMTKMTETEYIIEDLVNHIFVFKGEINNPEELKFLMICLGIIKE